MSEATSTLYRIFQERRSIRRFDGSVIPPETLQRVLEAATMAPSAHNRQPWRFVILTALEDKRSIANALGEELREDRLADGDDPGQIERDVTQSIERILMNGGRQQNILWRFKVYPWLPRICFLQPMLRGWVHAGCAHRSLQKMKFEMS
jgi:nitroreductase